MHKIACVASFLFQPDFKSLNTSIIIWTDVHKQLQPGVQSYYNWSLLRTRAGGLGRFFCSSTTSPFIDRS